MSKHISSISDIFDKVNQTCHSNSQKLDCEYLQNQKFHSVEQSELNLHLLNYTSLLVPEDLETSKQRAKINL